MKKTYVLNTVLTAVLFLACVAAALVRAFAPIIIIPALNIPNMVLLSVVALLIEHFLAKGNPRCSWLTTGFGVLSFGILPLMAGFACVHTFWKFGLIGGCVFAITTFLFTSIQVRLSSGPAAKASALFSAVSLYMAAQCLAGILL